MFNNKEKELNNTISTLRQINSNLEFSQSQSLKQIKFNNQQEIKEMEFKLDHIETEKLKELKQKNIDKNQKIAVLEKENKMLGEVIDLSSDIVSIKKLIENVIQKLPEINLKSLTIKNE